MISRYVPATAGTDAANPIDLERTMVLRLERSTAEAARLVFTIPVFDEVLPWPLRGAPLVAGHRSGFNLVEGPAGGGGDHLDRAHLPPSPAPAPPRPLDPRRVRDHPVHHRQPGGLTVNPDRKPNSGQTLPDRPSRSRRSSAVFEGRSRGAEAAARSCPWSTPGCRALTASASQSNMSERSIKRRFSMRLRHPVVAGFLALSLSASLGLAVPSSASAWGSKDFTCSQAYANGESTSSPKAGSTYSAACPSVRVRQRNAGSYGSWSYASAGFIYVSFTSAALGGTHQAFNDLDQWVGVTT